MVRPIAGAVAAIAGLLAAMVWLSGGVMLSLGVVQISSSDPIRLLLVAGIAAACYVAVSGVARLRRDIAFVRAHVTAKRVAGLLTIATLIVGIIFNSWSAGGPDSYSYVTQADLWLEGRLKTPVTFAAEVPWPNAVATFTPFGYRTVPNEYAIAPMTAPGLPILMAAFKYVAGHAAAFLVVPLTGAMLLWATFLVGTRLGSSVIGLGAAWLIATSPTFLMMFKSQMSDVPAAAFWTIAVYAALGRTVGNSLAAGLLSSVATLIRPNLVPIAGMLFLWLVARRPIRPALAFAAGAVPGCLAVASINTSLYGSPFSSGYGDLNELFSFTHLPVSLARHGAWFVETQTPVAAAGVIALAAAPRAVWSSPEARGGVRLLGLVVIVVWALHSVYPAFDAWWFLRFLLPSWPAIFIGATALVMWPSLRWPTLHPWFPAGMLVVLGLYGLVVASQRDVFPANEGERRYVTIAKLVEQQTEPRAVILASMHVGPTRYYSGRATMRFDVLDEAWLERAVQWLRQHERHPYLLIEDWEMMAFRNRFGGDHRLGDLDLSPILTYQAYRIPGRVYLFDLLRPDGPTLEPPPQPNPRPLCVAPAPPAPL